MRLLTAAFLAAILAGCRSGPATTSKPAPAPKPATKVAKADPTPKSEPKVQEPKKSDVKNAGDDADADLELMAKAAEDREAGARKRQETGAETNRKKLEEEARLHEERRQQMEADRQGVAATSKARAGGEEPPLFEEQYAEILKDVREKLQHYRE